MLFVAVMLAVGKTVALVITMLSVLVQPPKPVTVTLYVPPFKELRFWVVAPLLHR